MLLHHRSTGRVRFEMLRLEDCTVAYQCDAAELELKRPAGSEQSFGGTEALFAVLMELANAREFYEELQRAKPDRAFPCCRSTGCLGDDFWHVSIFSIPWFDS